jgi:hypothetical protein
MAFSSAKKAQSGVPRFKERASVYGGEVQALPKAAAAALIPEFGSESS